MLDNNNPCALIYEHVIMQKTYTYNKRFPFTLCDNKRENRIFVIGSAINIMRIETTARVNSYNNNNNHTASYMTIEEAREYLEGLHNNSRPELWHQFFELEEIKKILRIAVRASCLRGDFQSLVEEMAHAIYLYSVTEYNWVPKELRDDLIDYKTGRERTPNEPSHLPGYFEQVVLHLIIKRKFMRDYLGVDLKIDAGAKHIDEVPVEGRPLGEKISSDNTRETEIEEAKERIETFIKIVKIVEDRSPKHGELLRRYYIPPQDAMRVIAIDYLRRGVIKVGEKKYGNEEVIPEDVVQHACDNLQNSMLPRACQKFNDVALSKQTNLQLKGKVKKSIIKDIQEL